MLDENMRLTSKIYKINSQFFIYLERGPAIFFLYRPESIYLGLQATPCQKHNPNIAQKQLTDTYSNNTYIFSNFYLQSINVRYLWFRIWLY